MHKPDGPHPACSPPPAKQRAPGRIKIPPGAVDTHCHVIGAPPEYPYVAQRSYTPEPASAGAYTAMLDAMGMTYGVLVQVSVHGTDNRLLLEALRAHPKRLRGIAVAPLGLSGRAYEDLKAAGVVGLRLNVLFGGGIGVDDIEAYGALAADLGWHLQFLIDGDTLCANARRIADLKCPVVIDHMGYVPTDRGVNDPGFQTLVSLVRDGGWVKLSGAYRTSISGPPYADTIAFAAALIAAAPDRCVWGSDWPHVSHWGQMMQVADLLDLLGDWAPAEAARHKILVKNPAALYGFDP